jgi:hypothetical protein
MEVSKITPDTLRDPPKGHGNMQCPGPFMVIPARAYGDLRFNQYPKTFRCLAVCAAHANKNTGSFFIGQQTLGKILQCSQQAVQQHMKRLVEYNYLEKLYNGNSYHKKVSKWRVIYDERYTEEDCWAKTTVHERDEEEEKIIALKTLKAIETETIKPKTKPVDNSVDNSVDKLNNPVDNFIPKQAPPCLTHKPQLVPYYNKNYNIKNIKESYGINLCIVYSRICERIYGTGWRQNRQQVSIAIELLEEGYTIQTFEDMATKRLTYLLSKEKPHPFSLAYFLSKNKKGQKPSNVKEVLTQVSKSLRMK